MISIIFELNAISQFHAQTTDNEKQQKHCGADRSIEIQRNTPGFNEALEIFTKQFPGNNEKAAKIAIPVVFHVNKNSSPTQITMQRINSSIDILNEDLNAMNAGFSTLRTQFQSIAAKVGIQFCLTKIDPNGNATTGVTYPTNNYNGREPDNLGTTSKSLSSWPNNKYLNIWTCRNPSGNGDL